MKIELRTRPGSSALDTSLIVEGEVFRGTIDGVDMFAMGASRGYGGVNVETGEIILAHTVLMNAEHMPRAIMLPYGRDL